MKNIVFALLLCLYSSGLLADPKEALDNAFAFIERVTGEPVPAVYPPVEILKSGKEFKKFCPGAPKKTACYHSIKGKMYFSSSANLKDKQTLAIVVHEAFHHIQNLNMPIYAWDCPKQAEIDAVLIQESYVSKTSPSYSKEIKSLKKKYSCESDYTNNNIAYLHKHDPGFFTRHGDLLKLYWK